MNPPDSDAPGAARPRRRSRWRLLLWLAVAAGLVVAVRAALPWAAGLAVERFASDALDRPVQVGEVDLALLRGLVELRDVVVVPRPGGGPAGGPGAAEPPEAASPESAESQTAFVSSPRLGLSLDWSALVRGDLHLRAVELDDPVVRLERRPDGGIVLPGGEDAGPKDAEIEDAPPEGTGGSSAAPATGSEEGPPVHAEEDEEEDGEARIRLDRVLVDGGRVHLAEAGSGAALLDLSVAALELRDLAVGAGPVRLAGLGIESPELRVSRALLSPPPGADSEPADDAPGNAGDDGTGYRVERVRLDEGRLHLVEVGDGAALLDLSIAGLELRELSVGGGPVRLAGIGIEGPELRVSRDLLSSPSDAESAPSEEAPEDTGEAGAGYRVAAARVHRGRLTLEGPEARDPLELGLELEVTDVGAGPGERFPLTARITAGEGSLEAEGEAGLAPPAFAGSLAWSELPLLELAQAVAPGPAAWLRTGRSSGALEVDARLAPGPDGEDPAAVRLDGRASFAELDLQDPDGSGLGLGGRELEVRVREGSLPLDGEGGPQLRASGVEVRGAGLRLDDGRVAPAYRLRLATLEADAGQVRWPGPHALDLRVEARTADDATLRVTGGLPDGTGRLQIAVERLALPPLAPYTQAGTGVRFSRGSLSVEAGVELGAETTRIDSGWRFADARLAPDTDPGFFREQLGLSPALALALLRGPGGDIRLPVRLTVERGELTTHLGPVLRGAVRQALVGAVTTPLKAMGAVLPGGGAQAELLATPLSAETGRVELTARGEEELYALAALLASRPELAAVLRGRTSEADAEVPTVASGPDDGEGAAAPDTPEALAQARAAQVRDRLVAEAGVEPDRVAVAAPAPPGEPGVVVELVPVAP